MIPIKKPITPEISAITKATEKPKSQFGSGILVPPIPARTIIKEQATNNHTG